MQIPMHPSTANLLSIKFAYCVTFCTSMAIHSEVFCPKFSPTVESMKGTDMHMPLLWPEPQEFCNTVYDYCILRVCFNVEFKHYKSTV